MDVNRFKEKLLNLRDSLAQVEQSGKEAARTVELDQSAVGRLSRMDALQGQAMAKASHQRRMIQQQRIGSALQRIENGNYGVCVRCEEDIHLKPRNRSWITKVPASSWRTSQNRKMSHHH